jgi:hypothetical protein
MAWRDQIETTSYKCAFCGFPCSEKGKNKFDCFFCGDTFPEDPKLNLEPVRMPELGKPQRIIKFPYPSQTSESNVHIQTKPIVLPKLGVPSANEKFYSADKSIEESTQTIKDTIHANIDKIMTKQ